MWMVESGQQMGAREGWERINSQLELLVSTVTATHASPTYHFDPRTQCNTFSSSTPPLITLHISGLHDVFPFCCISFTFSSTATF